MNSQKGIKLEDLGMIFKLLFAIAWILGVYLIIKEFFQWLGGIFGITPKKAETEPKPKSKEAEPKPNKRRDFLASIGEEMNKDIKKLKFPTSFTTINEYFCLHLLDGRELENGETPETEDFYNKKLLRYDPKHIKNAIFMAHRSEHLTDLLEGTNQIETRDKFMPRALNQLSYYMVDIGKKEAIRSQFSEMKQIKQKYYDSIDKQAELISKMSVDESPEYDKTDKKRRVILDKLILEFGKLQVNINKLNEEYKKI